MVGKVYGTRSMLPRESLWTGARAESEIMWSLAGRARAMTEATFGAAVSGNAPVGPLPPHSDDPGHDHSGGVMGTPIVRGLWCFDFGMPNDVLGANITNGRAPQAEFNTLVPANLRTYLWRGSLKHLWIPGTGDADESCNVHKRATVLVGVYLYSSTGVNHDLKWAFRAMDSYLHTGSATMTANAETHLTLADQSSLLPGFFNNINLDLWVEGPTSSGTSRPSVLYISGNQTETAP